MLQLRRELPPECVPAEAFAARELRGARWSDTWGAVSGAAAQYIEAAGVAVTLPLGGGEEELAEFVVAGIAGKAAAAKAAKEGAAFAAREAASAALLRDAEAGIGKAIAGARSKKALRDMNRLVAQYAATRPIGRRW